MMFTPSTSTDARMISTINANEGAWDPEDEEEDADSDEHDEKDWDWGGMFISGSDDPPEDESDDA